MTAIDIYLKPACTTCRKAVADLASRGFELRRHDLAKDPPPPELLGRLIEELGIENVMNPRGRTLRERGIELGALTAEDAIRLILEEPNLMRRPLVLANGRAHFGYTAESYEELGRG